MAIQQGTFIEIDYTGKSEGKVFDTTKESVAKEAGLNPKAQYKPAIVCVGERQVLPGIDEFLIDKEPGTYTIPVPSEKGFGKKDPKLLKLIPKSKFKEAQVEPFPGLEVNIDDSYGVVRSVSGGRVTVDFNHPLASRDLEYEVDVKRIVEDPAEQAAALLDIIGLHHHGVTMESEKHAVVKVHELLPDNVAQQVNQIITRLTSVETVSYQKDHAGHEEAGTEPKQ